jgi:hypothetical protein
MNVIISTFKKHWLKIGIWLLIILPVGSFLIVSAFILAYMFWPRAFEQIDAPDFETSDSHVALLAHGLRDHPTAPMNSLRAAYEQAVPGSRAFNVDWSPYAQNSLTCATNGKRIGERIGRELATNPKIQSLHLVAHSCGAFVIYGACQAFKRVNKTATVQTTYLDPVSVYGIWWNYGLHHFGECADYSEAYIDTGDGVPGSNELIPQTHTYDVTAARKHTGQQTQTHLWPIEYYRQLLANGRAPMVWKDSAVEENKPAGVLEVVKD